MKSYCIIILICLISLARADDRAALSNFYQVTNGDQWIKNTNWNTDVNWCDWYGVICENGIVTRLDLANNDLLGDIGDSLNSLNGLKQMYLQNNQLSGSIDQRLFQHVLTLNLANNTYTGLLPEFSIENLTLTYVDLSDNYFYGKLNLVAPTIQYFNLLGNDISSLGQNLDWCDSYSHDLCINYNNMFPYNGYICPSISLGHYNTILVEPEVYGGYGRCNTCSIC